MKRTLAVIVMLLIAALAYSQSVQPNGPPQGTTTRGTQSLMYGGVHDFGPTSADSIKNQFQSDGTCDYCHRPHISLTDGQAAPLWARKSLDASKTYGVYNSVSLDVAPTANGDIAPINQSNNYSAFCLSCHDGSQFLATAAWGDNSHPYNGRFINGSFSNYWPTAWDNGGSPTTGARGTFADAGVSSTGDLKLDHTHPVNFTYATSQANDGQLYAAQAAGYVTLDNTTTPARALGRLFNGKMQCSSCHNPHFKTGIGLQGSGNKGALCVACHIK